MASPNNLVGAVLCGRYRLTKLIGQGGMGSVYEAHDRQMSDRVVAVKVLAAHLTSDETQVTRFEQEARAANQLRHPNTISVLDFGHTEDGLLFMALEYLHGETLTQVMRHGPLDPARGLFMLRQVCKSLAEAHAKGIIHRDLKPDNIFVCEIYGESDFIKVIDFGIAKLAVGGAELTQVGKMFGTPRYLSPEQAQGLPLTPPSDLYSLGVILFEMLTGQAPFHADDPMSIAIKHVQELPPALRDVAPTLEIPPQLEQMVAKLLAKRPARRFQTAEEVLAEIDACLHELAPNVRISGPLTPRGPMTPAKPKTIPPPLRAASGPVPLLAEDEATRTLTLNPDPTEAFERVPRTGEEATRAIDAVDDASSQAVASVVEAPAAGAAETESTGRGKSDGKTLALEVEEAPSGGVRARRERPAPQQRRRPAAASASAPPATVEEHDGPNKWVLLLVAVALAALGGGAAWWWRGAQTATVTDSEPAAPAAESAATRAPKREEAVIAAPTPQPALFAKPAAATDPVPYALEIASDPPGANVTVDAMPAGTAPVTLKLAGTNTLVAVLSLPGFDDYRLEIDPQKVRNAGIARMPIHLVAKVAPKPVTPKAAPRKAKIEW